MVEWHLVLKKVVIIIIDVINLLLWLITNYEYNDYSRLYLKIPLQKEEFVF